MIGFAEQRAVGSNSVFALGRIIEIAARPLFHDFSVEVTSGILLPSFIPLIDGQRNEVRF